MIINPWQKPGKSLGEKRMVYSVIIMRRAYRRAAERRIT